MGDARSWLRLLAPLPTVMPSVGQAQSTHGWCTWLAVPLGASTHSHAFCGSGQEHAWVMHVAGCASWRACPQSCLCGCQVELLLGHGYTILGVLHPVTPHPAMQVQAHTQVCAHVCFCARMLVLTCVMACCRAT